MIPKVIHYCWFGGHPLPDLAKKCIESWKRYCPDYEIKEWNDRNFNIDCCDFVKEAYEAKKWAFVSDFARLYVVYNEGGVYLDVDVELVKSLDSLLENPCFLGVETTRLINTGLGFGAIKGNLVVKALMQEYENHHFLRLDGSYDVVPCPKKNTEALLKIGYKNTKNIVKMRDATIYPSDWFCPLNYETGTMNITKNTISIHHYTATWHSKAETHKSDIRRFCVAHFGRNIGVRVADFISIPCRVVIKIERAVNRQRIKKGEKR